MIEGGVDEGDILAQAYFRVVGPDTALTLNTKCYAAAIDSFAAVIGELAKPDPARTPQDLSQRSYFARDDRPAGGARLDFTRPAADLAALVRALDHGDYWNPLACPNSRRAASFGWPRSAHVATDASGAAPGAVTAVDQSDLNDRNRRPAISFYLVSETVSVPPSTPTASPRSVRSCPAPMRRKPRL